MPVSSLVNVPVAEEEEEEPLEEGPRHSCPLKEVGSLSPLAVTFVPLPSILTATNGTLCAAGLYGQDHSDGYKTVLKVIPCQG